MLDRVASTIARHSMFDLGQRVGVAVSGGADSVCLLYLLRELAPRWNLQLAVIHLNHQLRGAESDRDAEFVCSLAAEFGLAFHLREVRVDAARGNLEQSAREARLDFFQELIASRTVDRIATGHTSSDQAETVLFRFLRGAGTAGLAGIRPVTAAGLVRPLIEVTRQETEEYLLERLVVWCEDSTNRSLEFARNRIRHDLLPALARDWNPALPQTLAQMADWALAEEQYWGAEITRLEQQYLQCRNGFVLVNADALAGLPLAASRRLVRRAIELVRGNLRAIDFAHVNAILSLSVSPEGHGRLQAPDVDVIRSFEWLRFAKTERNGLVGRNYRIPRAVPGIWQVPGEDFAVALEVIEKSGTSLKSDYVYNEEMVCVDWERLSGSLDLRNWRPGDQYQRAGSPREEKIKTLFQEFRVPLWERRHWPVLTDGDSIVWVRRFGPAAGVVASPDAKKLLKIQEIGIGLLPDGVYMSEAGREVS